MRGGGYAVITAPAAAGRSPAGAFLSGPPMRRLRPCLFAASLLLSLPVAAPSFAQYGGGAPRGASDQQAQEDAKKKKRDEELGAGKAALPALRNAGPCPFVKVLYDAARYVEFEDNRRPPPPSASPARSRAWRPPATTRATSRSGCRWRCCSSSGAGPQAEGARKTYRYWVAVTDRNREVLDQGVLRPAGDVSGRRGPGRR